LNQDEQRNHCLDQMSLIMAAERQKDYALVCVHQNEIFRFCRAHNINYENALIGTRLEVEVLKGRTVAEALADVSKLIAMRGNK